MSHPAAEIFHQAAAALADHPLRDGNVLHVPAEMRVVVGGDLHGHRQGLIALLDAADLAGGDDRGLLVQEIVHAPPDPRSGQDRSIEVLLRAARALIDRPRQVLMLMGNHDVAEVTDSEITKSGQKAVESFRQGVNYAYAEHGDGVLAAVHEMLRALPLAARTPGGVFLSHSVPARRRMETAGIEVLDRPYTEEDFHRGGSVYEWTWGRGQDQEQLAELAERLDASFFVLGHRQTPSGWEPIGQLGVTLASDHPRGAYLTLTGEKPLTAASLGAHVHPLAGS